MNQDGGTVHIDLFDYIGPHGLGFGVLDLKEQLSPTATQIALRIFSNGGSVFEGFAMHIILATHPAAVEVEVILAASAASTVAMAADPGKISISPLGFFMMHPPSAHAGGTAPELRQAADLLDKIEPKIIVGYLRHMTQWSAEAVAEAMAADGGAGTWFTAEEALAAGLAQSIMADAPTIENRLAIDSFDGTPPAAVLERFAAQQEPAPLPPPAADADTALLASILEQVKSATATNRQLAQHPEDRRLLDAIESLL